MTERSELQNVMIVKLREQADFLKHNVATWQLLARAADEIEQLKREVCSEIEGREKLARALSQKDEAMGVLFDRLAKAGVDCSDLFS